MKRKTRGFCAATFLAGLVWPLAAQEGWIAAPSQPPTRTKAQELVKRPCFAEAEGETGREREEAAIAKLPEHYRFWLTEDAVYIIAPGERCAYLQLSSNEEWDQFIDQFWIRRAPDPESLQNEYEEEHYRRIVYANENFAAQTAGWVTDRGHSYIEFGPPDKIELRASGEPTGNSFKEGPPTVEYPYEVWRYRYLEGLGENIELKFVDTSGLGDYRLTVQPENKDQVGFAPRGLGSGCFSRAEEQAESERIEVYVRPSPHGIPRYKDLEAMAASRIVRKEVAFRHETEYRKATHATSMAKLVIAIGSDQLKPAGTDGQSTSDGFEIFGRLSKPGGWVVSTFEFSEAAGEAQRADAGFAAREVTIPLEPGKYQLALVVKDVGSGLTGTEYTSVEVPTFDELTVDQ